MASEELDLKSLEIFGNKNEAKLPRALEIQKHKFLRALGKAEPSPTEEEDEQFIKEYFAGNFAKPRRPTVMYRSLLWKDTVATEKVGEILKEHQNFDIRLYVDCAKAIYLTYTGKIKLTTNFYRALTYVITHGRAFGDPTQTMFRLESNGSFEITFEDLSKPLPDSVYMKEITALIKDLQTKYDEAKYQVLNTNVTYLSLLILRRFVKKDIQFLNAFKRTNTHDDYVTLCPYPLNNQLPKVTEEFNKHIHDTSLKTPVLLAIHAHLTGNDAITKRVLQVTCLQHVEWTGLQLPTLFFQVASLYRMEEGNLWDLLCFNGTSQSLLMLAEEYYKQYKMSKADPPETVAWFPYCRALEGDYHRNLSASENKGLCLLLAYIIDLKKGFNNSFVRDSHWAAKCGMMAATYLDIAKAFHEKYNNTKTKQNKKK